MFDDGLFYLYAENMPDKEFEKLPPQSIEAEQSVLGSLLLDKKAIVKIADILKPDDFYRDVHKIIYETMLELFEKNEPIDIMTASNRLEEKERLEKNRRFNLFNYFS